MGGALGFHYPLDGSLFVPRRVLQLVTLCCANSLTQLYQSTCSSRSVISISILEVQDILLCQTNVPVWKPAVV